MTISTILIFKFDRDKIETVDFFLFIFFIRKSVDISYLIFFFLYFIGNILRSCLEKETLIYSLLLFYLNIVLN